jgi:hypothetical protein
LLGIYLLDIIVRKLYIVDRKLVVRNRFRKNRIEIELKNTIEIANRNRVTKNRIEIAIRNRVRKNRIEIELEKIELEKIELVRVSS